MNSNVKIIQTSQAIDKAKTIIYEERSGEQHGLYCRWQALNRGMLKYWRFEHTTMIAGMSGSGKSYFLNMLRQDFLDQHDVKYRNIDAFNLNEVPLNCYYDPDTGKASLNMQAIEDRNLFANAQYYPKAKLILHDNTLIHKAINKGCKHKVILIHFGFEMPPADELLRTCGNILGKSYGFLLSSDWSDDLKDYIKLTDAELKSCEEVLDSLHKRREYYIPTACNVHQIEATVDKIVNSNPGHKFVVTIDHTLLAKKSNEKGEAELQANMGLLAIKLRETYGAMVIYLNQLNQSIESEDRILKPAMHYPSKKDIYHGSQVWWAMDNVLINHRPAVLRIQQYGLMKLQAAHLLHGALVKSRKGQIGNIFFKEDFANGRILSATSDDFKP